MDSTAGQKVTHPAASLLEERTAWRTFGRHITVYFIPFVIVVSVVTWKLVDYSQHQIIEYQARDLAEIVARQAAGARSVYSQHVVGKLKEDGFGADIDAGQHKGYVPLPAQFLKLIGRQSADDSAGLYRYKPLSKWNMAEDQGLSDEFHHWAWPRLEAQDLESPDGPINWQPVSRVEYVEGVRTLRLMRPDPATSQGCVGCHNSREGTQDVQLRRERDGVAPGKQWKQHQLLGAIEVQIPLERVEAHAQHQIHTIMTLIVALVATGLLAIGFFIFLDISRTRGMARQLSYQASHDTLTGLINRAEFERRSEMLLRLAKTDNSHHGLLFIDLDQFKVVNDTCGHMAGDELLRQLGPVIRPVLRSSDTLARLGGDEFGVLLQSCSRTQALKIAEDLRQKVRDFRFIWGKDTFQIGVSIGLVSITPHSESISVLMSAADVACYLAKDEGRNRIHALDPMDDELELRRSEMGWVSRINQHLEEGQMGLAVQDALALQPDARPQRYREILLRPFDENGNPVSPAPLISAAERYDLMQSVDRWVVRTVFEMITEGRLKVDENSMIAINLSGTSLNDDSLLDFIREQFWTNFDVPTSRICFEITETAAIRNLAKVKRLIHALRNLGCRFALDDFGSGLSSFGYLKHLPVDFLKIDGEIVKDIASDPVDCAMVEAIVHIGRTMGIPTIAEWVENETVLERAKALGVIFVQGYGVHRPQLLDLKAKQVTPAPGLIEINET